jgi:putative ABC transport system permease protein
MGSADLWRRLRYFVRRENAARDLEEEMRLHVELRAARLREHGETAESAEYLARRRFGHPTALAERSRDAWGLHALESFTQDLRYAVRTLARSPGFTLVAVATLALGIGANAAVFSTVDAVLVRRLPFADADRLVMVWEDASLVGFPRNTPAPGNYADWSTRIPSLQSVAALDMKDLSLTGDGAPEKIGAAAATANFFPVMGVQPIAGRWFLPAEDTPGTAHVVVIGHSLWTRRYAADPKVVGRDIRLDGEKYTVVGVMPPRFSFPFRDVELWVPVQFTSEDLANRGGHYLWVVGRMAPGRTLKEINAELGTLATRLAHDHPDTNRNVGMFALPLRDDYLGDLRVGLLVLVGSVALVLLITCANIANLMLARVSGRTRELAVRSAIGAGGWRLARQLVTESLLLSSMGGAAGLLVANASLGVLQTLVPDALQDMSIVRLDWRVVAFTFLVASVTGVLFGLVPAWQVARTDLTGSLKQAAPGGINAGRGRWRNLLVVGEIATALLLLIGATLLVESFSRLRSVDPGFRSEQLLTARLSLSAVDYASFPRRVAFVDQVLERVRRLPGVRSAGITSALPLVWKGGTTGFFPEGTVHPDPKLSYDANNRVVTPGYMETMRMSLAAGRLFDARDGRQAPPVVIVNETMAREYWPEGRALGQRLKRGDPADPIPWLTIVGVVKDVRSMGLDQPARPEMYFPLEQSDGNWMWPRDLVVRAAGDPLSLADEVRRSVWAVDPQQPVSRLAPMDDIVDSEVLQRRTEMRLLAGFAGLAMVLASLGIYGVLSLMVGERTQEIGLRLAVGAAPGAVLRLVVGRGMRLATAGVAVGLLVAWWATQFLESLLFGVSAHDPWVFAGLGAAMLVVAFASVYAPARRASRVDPLLTLRAQ